MSTTRRSNKSTVATDEVKKTVPKKGLTVFPLQSPLHPNHVAYMALVAEKEAKKKTSIQKKGVAV